MDCILIPVKRFDRAKLRLSQRLTPADRRRLGLAMLADVLRSTEKWPHRLVVTEDPDAEAVGVSFGCDLVRDPRKGLNSAIVAGSQRAAEMGATSLLVLPADVPLVSSDDIAELFGRPEQVVVVASGDGGTNALMRRPPHAIPPAFGPASARRHLDLADQAGLETARMELSSLLLDIDRYADLAALKDAVPALESVRLARRLLDQTLEEGA
ncbi:MAG: 2-phospho-L-lactate guanylyltransferase [Actinobacteria bacterium]|nr:2-phospho-L-lactate guanylyltransferase [Actinomycetota bacterium]